MAPLGRSRRRAGSPQRHGGLIPQCWSHPGHVHPLPKVQVLLHVPSVPCVHPAGQPEHLVLSQASAILGSFLSPRQVAPAHPISCCMMTGRSTLGYQNSCMSHSHCFVNVANALLKTILHIIKHFACLLRGSAGSRKPMIIVFKQPIFAFKLVIITYNRMIIMSN
jgi:hypothetical protein